jgi:iron complex outermembrane receptor protein
MVNGDVFEVAQPVNTGSGCGSYYNIDPDLMIPVGSTSYADGVCPVPGADDPYTLYTNGFYFLDAEQKTYSIEFNGDYDWGSVKALAAHTDNENFRGNDGDQGPGTAYISGEVVTRKTDQVEVHFVDNGEGKVSWLVGAFYLKEDNHDNFFFNSDSADTQGAQFDFTCTTSRDADTESTAVFGQVTVPVGDNTRITAGARYSREENDWAINDQFGYYYEVPIPRDIRDIDLESGPFAIQGPDVLVSDTFRPFTWRLAVDHDLSDDSMIYGYVATGYSSGGFNSRQNPENGLFTYPESETTTYEFGWKSTLLDGAMTLNLAAYYNDFKDYIAERSTVLPSGSVIVFASLGGSAESKGIELEMDWIPAENWLVNLRGSLMDSEFNPFITSLGGTLTTAGDLLAPPMHLRELRYRSFNLMVKKLRTHQITLWV